ncbi:hypothetical protein M8J76_005337 [Diaphorina citri]|nr:hypothetical protein M8J75_004850 [Diaphorina citri]KAI5740595.1 hypothetical protein M8J76_005337 [Diaphorina citri]
MRIGILSKLEIISILTIFTFFSTTNSLLCPIEIHCRFPKNLEKQFALQLEEQEVRFGPARSYLPSDLSELSSPHHLPNSYYRGSTRSSLSSVSAE